MLAGPLPHMKGISKFFTLTFAICLFGCQDSSNSFERTEVGSIYDKFYMNKHAEFDTVALSLLEPVGTIPKSILKQVYEHAEGTSNFEISDQLSEAKNYPINDRINLMNIILRNEDVSKVGHYLGIYKPGNFDFFSFFYSESDSVSFSCEVVNYDSTNNSHLITTKIIMDGDIYFQRNHFKDTLNQLVFIKIDY